MKLKRPAKWNGKWRLVMFDIPHGYKRARDAFRQKLKRLEFYPIQKSVFITPYPCEDEIDFLASVFDIRKHVILMNIADFEGEEKLKRHFRI
jgi:DNA-binding transcriptional regulator PaaX